MRDIFEKLIEADEEQEEDRYDPKKNLRSKIINIFYKEGYSFDEELEVDSKTQLKFKKGDSIVKVIM